MATQAPPTKTTVRIIRIERVLKETHQPRRLGKAMSFLRNDIARHSKSLPENVSISQGLNRYMLMGSSKGYSAVKISVEKTGEKASAYLDGEKKPVPQKKEEKKEKKEEEKSKKAETKATSQPTLQPAAKNPAPPAGANAKV